MLIAVINSKGGTGKTTIAVHAAVWLQEQGLRVAVLDADDQRSASQWLEQAAPELPLYACASARDVLERSPELLGRYDAVIADGPASLGARITALASVADLALMPIMPSMLDIWASFRTARLIYKVRFHPKRRGRPRALTVLNRAQSRTRLARLAATAVQQYGFPVSPVVLEARTAYAEACQSGTVAWRLGARAARATAELRRLFELMLEQLPDCPAACRVLARRRAAKTASVAAQRSADANHVQTGPPPPLPTLEPPRRQQRQRDLASGGGHA